MKRADHIAIIKTINDYDSHVEGLRKFVIDQPMKQSEIFELITNEVGYAITLLSNNLLEFGDKEK